jgi:hypothetical protein
MKEKPEHLEAKFIYILVFNHLICSVTKPFEGRAIAQAVSRCFPPRWPGFDLGSGQVGFVVDKVALGRVFSEYFGFHYQSSFHQILHHHNHPEQATIGQSVAAVPSGHSWTPSTH